MDRTSQPPFQQSLEFNLPVPERFNYSGNREIVYLPSNLSEAVKIEFVFEAGKYFEPQSGIAQFTAHLLDKGTSGIDANQIANTLDHLGSHLEISVGFDFTSISLYALRKNVKKLLPVFISILRIPEFPEKELINYQRIFIENLKVSLEKNAFIASNLIRKNIFGDHPYGKSIQVADIDRIETDALKAFFRNHFQPFKVFIIGAIEKEDLHFLTREIDFSSTQIEISYPVIEPLMPVTEMIHGPNKIQTSIKMGRMALPRTHADFPRLVLLNHLFGGYFGSRLMKNIREEKGLTYGIYSSVQSLLNSSSLIISADVNTDKSELVLEEIKKELLMLTHINSSELEICKSHLIGSLQSDITTVFAAGERIKSTILANLPMDYYKKMILDIGKAGSESLHQIGVDLFLPREFSTIVVK